MRRLFLSAAYLALSSTSAFAGGLPEQGTSNTAIGIGSARSTSVSAAKATAISGQGGAGVGVGSVTIQGAAPPPSATTSTITTQGHSSVSTVPSVFAPGLAAAGIESCLGSVSGGGSWLGTGVTLGGSIPDLDCSARLDARTLWSFGLKRAAVSRLCQNTRIYESMPEVCGSYMPRPVYASTPTAATYASVDAASLPPGTILLIEGKTGKERPCSNYDTTHQRCRQWADAVTSKPKQVARVAWSRESKPAASSSPTKEARSEEPHPVPLPVARPLDASHPVSQLGESLERPLWIRLIHPEQPATEPKKEVPHDESIDKCLGFCAVPSGKQR